MKQMEYEEMLAYNNRENVFARENGIIVTEMKDGHALVQAEITERHRNQIHSIHGGCLYTIADVAGGYAALSLGRTVTTVDSDFHFLRAGLNIKLVHGEGRVIKRGKRLIVVQVELTDQDGTVLCVGTLSYMVIDVPA